MNRARHSGVLPAGIVCFALAACGQATPPADPAGAKAAPGVDAANTPIHLLPEAARQAGIVTEVEHPAPFAVTLSLPCRLSPSAETPEEVEARLNFQAAEARFVRAEAELERLRKLLAQEVVSAKEVQTAEAEFAEARVDRQRAQTALNNLGLDAARQESFPRADMWALAEIYEPQVAQVKPGAPAWLHVVTSSDELFQSRVVSLAHFLKPQTRTLTARIAVQDPGHRLRPQEIGSAEIRVDERTALSVPTSALLYEGTSRVLFVKRGDAYEKVRVRVGAEQVGRAEILDGVSDGDEVVTRGAQSLLGEMFKTRIPAEEDDEDKTPGDR
ncbi:MAG TPA: efflux RND transporter periplasmic adaptor subunit [Candidatus Polarisedimenticolia bacterium]|nr:efflux RND transporter periplasmic adaptor subunit [Candidatus Polarisedimenticolia bacterium]